MAIKINNTTVIDDSRQFYPIAISAGSTVGTAGSVLVSTGTGVIWDIPTSGSGSFDVGISSSIYVSVTSGIGTGRSGLSTVAANNNIFIGPGIAYSFPPTSGVKYVINSIHVTNTFNNELYLSARHDFGGSQRIPIANRLVIPYNGSTELLSQPMVANPSDIIRLQALSGIGTTAGGVDGGLDAFIVYSEEVNTKYIGIGTTVTRANQEIYTASSFRTVVQSIRLANYNPAVDVDASIALYRGGTVGSIPTTGVRQGYLTYNMTIPRNSIVEILEQPKYLAISDTIVATASTIGLSVCVAAIGY